jgi:hypothetical protein
MVLDLPPGDTNSKFLGTILDSWQVPLNDIGVDGKIGKYLILPPDYKAEVPAGYIALRPKSYGSQRSLRA